MEEIILVVLFLGLFIFLLWTFIKPQKKVKQETKKEEKPAESKKDEIPEILKDVTMGNYMYDISQTSMVDGVEILEDDTLEKPVEEETDSRSKIEKAFDEITDIGSDFEDSINDEISEIDDYGTSLLNEVDECIDEELLLEEDESENKDDTKKENPLTQEYKGLSKEMKAMLIANILEKKHK